MNNTAVVILTCKKYKQLWGPFFILLDKYWADCPFKIYMVSDYEKYEHEKVSAIEIGQDLGFTNNLLFGLNKIVENNIIYFQEDYLFNNYFDTQRIENCIAHMADFNVSCLRLVPCPGPSSSWEHSTDFGVLQKGDQYRISTQTAIWNKEYLKSMLVPGESGASFEMMGTKRSYLRNETLLSVWRDSADYPGGPTPYFISAVTRGVWEDGALELLKKEGISLEGIQKIIQ